MTSPGIRRVLAAAGLAGTLLAAPAWAKSSAAGTHGVWLGAGANAKIDTNGVFTVFIYEDSRFGEKNLEEQHGKAGLVVRPLDWLTLAPHYHFIDARKKSGGKHHWEREHRGALDITPSWTIGGWTFSDRSRVAYRDFENSQGFWRYRNRLQVASPWKWTDYKINPYASWELFLDDGKPSKHVRKNDKFDQWRFTAGVTARLGDHAKLNLFYLLQEKKDTSDHTWSPNHVIGANVTFSF